MVRCVLVWGSLATLVLLGAAACDAFVAPVHQLPPPPPSTAYLSSPTPIGGPTSTPIPTLAGPQPTVVPLGGQPIECFRFVMVISDTTTAGTDVTRLKGEWTTEALHMVTTIATDEGDQKTESYLIGDTAYVQDPSGGWTKGPSGDPASRALMNPTGVLKQAQDQGGLTLTPLGTSTVDGVPCARYQISTQGVAEAGSLFAQGVAYVGLGDGWVYRFEFERAEEGLLSQGVMTCYEYNTAITIQPPM